MARLDHPGAPTVYDAGAFDDSVTGGRRLFQVMQFIRGNTVSDLIAEAGALPIGWAACITAQVCAVLSAAHELSILHRDLKPDNLMICPDGSVKVLDFGLALLNDPRFSRYTGDGQVMGTPSYMSPEQIRSRTLDPRSDLYSLGCLLYEMLTGVRAFLGPSDYDTLRSQVNEEPRAITSLRTDIPPALEDLISAMLAKRPEDRPPNAREVFNRLSPFVDGAMALPGFVGANAAASPLQMYARTLTAVRADGQVEEVPAAPATDISRFADAEDLRSVRSRAASLAMEARYSQAVDLLTEAIGPARRSLGPDSTQVLGLRLELADLLFEGGDYRRAVSEYRDLAEAYTRRGETGGEPAYHCRFREAVCWAMGGETGTALRRLAVLLEEQRGVHGDSGPRPVELRKQIGLLHLSAGDDKEAERILTALRSDIVEYHGLDHPEISEVNRIIAHIHDKEP